MARVGLSAIAVIAVVALATPTAGGRPETPASASRDWAYALAIQPDGKLVAAGRSVGGGWRFAIARYTTRGKLDPSFGRGGKAFARVGGGNASALAIQRDGRIVAAGQAYVGPEQELAVLRYTSQGRLDTSFGRGGTVLTDFSPRTRTYHRATGLALQHDGKLVLAGYSVKPTFDSARRVLARYTARGRLDRSFGRHGKLLGRAGAFEVSTGVAVQRDGRIVAAGSRRSSFVLARYTARGRLDASFGQGGTVSTTFGALSVGHAVTVQQDGKIVAVGTVGSDFGIARFTAGGALDRDFGSGGKVMTNIGLTTVNGDRYPSEDRGLAVAVQADGKLVVAGSSDALGHQAERYCCVQDFALARYTADGRLDPSFGDGGKALTHFGGISYAEGVVIQPDGKIVAAGGGGGYFVLARYTPDGRLDPTFGRGGKVQTTLRPRS